MVKDFKFDDAFEIKNKDGVSFHFRMKKEGYDLYFRVESNKDVVVKFIDIDSSKLLLFQYTSDDNCLGIDLNLAKTEYVVYEDMANDSIFTLSIYLETYKRKTDGKIVPKDMVNQIYELLACIYNKKPFRVNLSDDKWAYFND